MYSGVRLGNAVVTVKVKGRTLIWQYVLCCLALIGAFVLLAISGFVVLGLVIYEAFASGSFDPEIFFREMQGSLIILGAIIFGYLLTLGAFILMIELFIGLGFWRLIATGATIAGADSLDAFCARNEDRALAGEGLADALQCGGLLMLMLARFYDGKHAAVRAVQLHYLAEYETGILLIGDAANGSELARWVASDLHLVYGRKDELRLIAVGGQRPARWCAGGRVRGKILLPASEQGCPYCAPRSAAKPRDSGAWPSRPRWYWRR
ncbi:MAG: hypothetical protein MO846_05360 [Candidatus Devosia symbiotica]|nr:hypothetical protein [Candidatus Devosia symbiotica]